MTEDVDMPRPWCAANGRPYGGFHTLLSRVGFMVIEPSGTILQFCDTDCLVRYYEWREAKALAGGA
ncbi:MAG: hypothetical protein V4529_17460 [Gemmatimonadota bacterium]